MPRKHTVEEILAKKWITVSDVVILGAAESEKTIYNRLSDGTFPIPSTKFLGKRLFKLDDVLTLLEGNYK